MQEPEVGGAPEGETAFATRATFLAGATRKPSGPNPAPALTVAVVGAALIALAGVLIRHVRVATEPGFTQPAQLIELGVWIGVGIVVAAAVLWLVYAPRKGLKLKVGHLLAMAAGALVVAGLGALWIGAPTAAEILDHKVGEIAARAKNDSTSDIMLFKSQARTEAWMARVDPASIDKEQNLEALRKTIEGTDDYVNDYKTRLANRRKDINARLDMAAHTPEERVHAQDLYNRLTGDLTAQEDRFWDIQAQAVNLGCALVDNVANLRAWKDAAAHGYPVLINDARFMTEYKDAWQKLSGFRDLLDATAKAINRPIPGPGAART